MDTNANLPWQAKDVLEEIRKHNLRPGGKIGHDQLWHALGSGETVAVGAKALADLGLVIQLEHGLELTEEGYGFYELAGLETNAPRPKRV